MADKAAAPVTAKKFASVGEFLLPDFSKCGQAAEGLPDSWITSIDFLQTVIAGEQQDQGGNFKYDFFTCYEDLPVCLWMLCCPFCTGSRTLEAVDGRSYEAHCIYSCCACCLGPCYLGRVRTEFRKKYNIAGSNLADMLMACCLGSCMMCQFAREARDRHGFTMPLTEQVGAKLPATLAPNGQVATRESMGSEAAAAKVEVKTTPAGATEAAATKTPPAGSA